MAKKPSPEEEAEKLQRRKEGKMVKPFKSLDKPVKPPKPQHTQPDGSPLQKKGGWRPGAGRPKGSKDKIKTAREKFAKRGYDPIDSNIKILRQALKQFEAAKPGSQAQASFLETARKVNDALLPYAYIKPVDKEVMDGMANKTLVINVAQPVDTTNLGAEPVKTFAVARKPTTTEDDIIDAEMIPVDAQTQET